MFSDGLGGHGFDGLAGFDHGLRSDVMANEDGLILCDEFISV